MFVEFSHHEWCGCSNVVSFPLSVTRALFQIAKPAGAWATSHGEPPAAAKGRYAPVKDAPPTGSQFDCFARNRPIP